MPVIVDSSITLEGYRNYFDIKNISLSGGYKLNDLWELKVRSSISLSMILTQDIFIQILLINQQNPHSIGLMSPILKKNKFRFNIRYKCKL